jgi:hypothetical protein
MVRLWWGNGGVSGRQRTLFPPIRRWPRALLDESPLPHRWILPHRKHKTLGPLCRPWLK